MEYVWKYKRVGNYLDKSKPYSTATNYYKAEKEKRDDHVQVELVSPIAQVVEQAKLRLKRKCSDDGQCPKKKLWKL
jgi:hypothetical protein